jgi:alpha-maltose-1-phosphate synthase
LKILLIQLIGKGGTQLYISQLAKALSRTGNEVVVFLGNYLYVGSHYADSNVRIVPIDASSSYLHMILKMINPLIYYKIIKLIENEKPDIIHAVFEDSLLGILLYLIKNKYPIVYTEHDPEFHYGEKFLVKLNQGMASKLLRKSSKAIIVHGENLKKILVTNGIREKKIWVIPHGDFSFYEQWSTETKTEEKTILFFGSIQAYKGLDYLIQAVAIILPLLPDLRVIIAGNGDFSRYSKIIDENNLHSHFEIHNRFIPDEEVSQFFQRSSIVILPYVNASQSGIIPIAYSFKKPVIATNVGSIPEILDNGINGLIIPPRDSNALATAIFELLTNNQLRKEMGENAYNKMKIFYNWDIIAKKTLTGYSELIRKNSI